jgi:hypothetical protein
MKRTLPVLLLLTALTCAPAWAQTSVGPYIGADVGRSNSASGIAATFGLGRTPLEFSPSAEASLSGGFSSWRLNADALYRLGLPDAFLTPYVGTGLTLGHRENHGTKPGVNGIAGARLNFGVLQPFAQSRLSVGSNSSFSVTGGFLIRAANRR